MQKGRRKKNLTLVDMVLKRICSLTPKGQAFVDWATGKITSDEYLKKLKEIRCGEV